MAHGRPKKSYGPNRPFKRAKLWLGRAIMIASSPPVIYGFYRLARIWIWT